MNKLLLTTLCASILLSSVSTASATLINRGGGLIYDTDLNITWLQDSFAQSFHYDIDAKMNWIHANTWANDLSYFDNVRNVTYTDWRLPTGSICSGYGICFGGEMDHLYYNELGGKTYGSITVHHNDSYNLFNNLLDSWYWTGTEYVPHSDIHMAFAMGSGIYEPDSDFGVQYYVMAVRDGDVALIPEPSTYAMLLAGLGLLSFIACRKEQNT